MASRKPASRRSKAAKRLAADIVGQFEAASPRARKDMAEKLVRYLKLGVLTVSSVSEEHGVELNPDMEAFQKAFSNQVWVYAGINAIATSAAQVPFKVMRRNKKGELEEVVGHRFIELLNNPSEYLSGFDLIELMMIFLESSGNNYWLLETGSAEPLGPNDKLKLAQVKELWPIAPQHLRPLPSKKNFVRGYKMAANELGKEITFGPAEIVHIRYANPASLLLGQGALEPVRGSITGDLYAELWNNTFFKNGAIPPAFLKTEKTLSPEQREELKASWARVYSGARNAHKVALLEAGLDFSVPSQSRKDMEFVEGQGQNMKRILGALGVPPIMIGLLDEATYNNAREQKRVFWENTMRPKLAKIASTLTGVLHRLGEPEELVVVADLSGIEALQDDLAGKANVAKLWRDMGVPLNACIRAFGPKGLEPVDGGDVGLVQAGLIPLEDAALGGPLDEPDPEGTPEDAPAGPKKPKPGEPDPTDEDDGEKGAEGLTRAGVRRVDSSHWRSFMARQEQDVRKFRALMRRHFKAQKGQVLELVRTHYKDIAELPNAKLRAPKVEVLLVSTTKAAQDLRKESRPLMKATYSRFGASVATEVGSDIEFNIESANAVKFLDRRSFRFAQEVTETTQARLRDLFGQALEEGVSQSDLIDRVNAEFAFADRTRATRIARTETQIAANAGIQDGYLQNGIEEKKWISSRDEKVRDSHKAADGEIVSVRDPFDVGGVLLMHPGDPDGPAEETVNCRCTTRAIIRRNE